MTGSIHYTHASSAHFLKKLVAAQLPWRSGGWENGRVSAFVRCASQGLPLAIARLARQRFRGRLGRQKRVWSGANLLPTWRQSKREAPESVQGSVTLWLCEEWVGRCVCPQSAEEGLAVRLECLQQRETVRTPVEMSGHHIQGLWRELAGEQVHKLSAAQTAGRGHGANPAGSLDYSSIKSPSACRSW
jgi:hypothetical protein